MTQAKHPHHHARRVSSIHFHKRAYGSTYTGSIKGALILKWKCFFIKTLTLGFGYPWAMCIKYKAQCHNQYICGRQLKFIGDPRELFRHWAVWWALCILSFGLFSHIVGLRMKQWVSANTVFADTEMISREEVAKEIYEEWQERHQNWKDGRAERKAAKKRISSDPSYEDIPDDYTDLTDDYEEMLEECQDYLEEDDWTPPNDGDLSA
ncbi:MAG: hypothetical protein PHN26_09965 [Eubacteriaceae bacterium]|nr:hypothetical protein [Eubacteriaceae bacterium]